jgi:hypothetical protein
VPCGLVLQIAGHLRKALFALAVPDGTEREHFVAERTQPSEQFKLQHKSHASGLVVICSYVWTRVTEAAGNSCFLQALSV